ncbi:MAG TPA: ABC transporter ATP-binding protein [Nonomuraea sp.]|nr:ABC transporter ATP-binding protein [Nonomuraea sp.]
MTAKLVPARGWSLLRDPFRRQRRAFGVLTGCSAVEAAPVLCSGWLLAQAIDQGFLARQPTTGVCWLAAYAAAMLLAAYATRLAVPAVADVVESVRDALVTAVVRGSLRRAVQEVTEGDPAAVARITRQTEQARQITAGLLFTLRHVAFSTVAAVAGLLALAPFAALAAAPALLAAAALFAVLLRALRPRQRALLAAEEEVSASVGATLAGLRDVLATGAVSRATIDVERRLAAHATTARRLATTSAYGTLVVAVGARLPLLLTIALAPALVRGGHLTPGEVVGTATYLISGLEPALRVLVQSIGQMGLQLGTTLQRLAERSAATPAPGLGGAATRTGMAKPERSDIVLERVTFAHGAHADPLLREVTVDIPAGDHLAIVGPSGAGKSTFANVLAGLAAPQEGRVLLGGVPLGDVDDGWLRHTVAMVPQESYVFAGTVRDNLVYLRPDATDADLDGAAGTLGLSPLVRRLGGYDAWLDDPSALAAGERQLITLLRAYLSPARVVILDEATCHLDPVREERVERAFAGQGRTLVVIAHRISSAARARRIMVLDNGSVLLGDHASLPARSPVYAEAVGLWSARKEDRKPPWQARCPEGIPGRVPVSGSGGGDGSTRGRGTGPS